MSGCIHSAVEPWGWLLDIPEEGVDVAAEFQILPNPAIRFLFREEDKAEEFATRVKFLFDAGVLQMVDLESLVFASEQLTDRLLQAPG